MELEINKGDLECFKKAQRALLAFRETEPSFKNGPNRTSWAEYIFAVTEDLNRLEDLAKYEHGKRKNPFLLLNSRCMDDAIALMRSEVKENSPSDLALVRLAAEWEASGIKELLENKMQSLEKRRVLER